MVSMIDFSPIVKNCNDFFSAADVPKNASRIFHGRGHCYPGLEWCVLDYYGPLVLLTVFTLPDDDTLNDLEALLLTLLPSNITYFAVQRRDLPNAPYHWLKGNVPEPGAVYAMRDNLQFQLDFRQQNSGYFLDMEPGREWLANQVAGARVLNLFAYTCAFSVVAIESGAQSVVNVDLSRRSLTTGRENHRLNRHDTNKVQFLGVDILKSWGKLKKMGPYDIVIVDPPSFQKGSFVATKDYQKVVRRLPELLTSSGKVLACLNAPEFSSGYLKSIFTEQAPSLSFIERLAPSASFPDKDDERQLKLLVYSA
jgi:23S rRNA (cytosine1962-C5)-methyltransferase